MLSRLMRLFQPLVIQTANRTLMKEFSMTDRLSILIAEQPQRILQEAAGLVVADADDQRSLLLLLHAETSAPHVLDPAP